MPGLQSTWQRLLAGLNPRLHVTWPTLRTLVGGDWLLHVAILDRILREPDVAHAS